MRNSRLKAGETLKFIRLVWRRRRSSVCHRHRELLALVKDKSVVLEEYATRMVAAEAVHIRELELMLMKRAPD
jgi:hypothetical protein